MNRLLSRLTKDRSLILLLATFTALALFYSILIPLFEGPDEDDHFRYAKFIAAHRALPVQRFEPGGGEAGHQGWQPPLYYSLAALLIKPIDTSDFSQHLYRNNAATFVGDPSCCGRNIYYHFANEDFPYSGTTLAVHLARLLSVFFGALTVWATYSLAGALLQNSADRLLTTNYRLLPLAAASVVAFNPSFLFASALVSNDAMLAALSALVLLMWAKLLCGQIALNAKSAAMIGALIGLGVLIKTTALGLFPLTVLLLAVLAFRRQRGNVKWFRDLATHFCLLTFSLLLFSGWWFARNYFLYGDPLASRLIEVSALFPRTGALTLAELFTINLPWLWQTFWGGPTPGDFPTDVLVLLAGLAGLAMIGLARGLFRRSDGSTSLTTSFGIRIAVLLLGLWLVAILTAQIQFIRVTQGADQGRYLFPAISAFALFFALGLAELPRMALSAFRRSNYELRTTQSESRITIIGFGILNSALFLLALATPILYTLPNYARPALLSPAALSRVPNPISINFANQIELRGYAIDAQVVKPGESLGVTLYWCAIARMPQSYRVFVQMVGTEDRIVASADVIPARGAFPTLYWNPGDAFRDVVRVPVRADAPPDVYELQVGLYPLGRPRERLDIVENGESSVVISTVQVSER